MDKLTIATQVLLKLIETDKTGFDAEGIAAYSFEIADALQAEADKRKPSGLPEALKEEWQPDWSQAPKWANWWVITDEGSALWCMLKPTCMDSRLMLNGVCNPAPSFGFTGTHIVERPQ